MKCKNCIYQEVCFPLLKFMHETFNSTCLQGRKIPVKKEVVDAETPPVENI
jgi:hypothetical protein